jgi:hypothetical protein
VGNELPLKLEVEEISSYTSELWRVWVEEFSSSGRKPTLTGKRRKLLDSLYREQLRGTGDPAEAFRRICRAVKASPHHMSVRAYQLPESFLRNPERRERWALQAEDLRARGTSGSRDFLDGRPR